jgi:hypothetical protein
MKIEYYDDDGRLLGVEIDESGLDKADLAEYLNDSNIEQTGPEGWTQFKIVD